MTYHKICIPILGTVKCEYVKCILKSVKHSGRNAVMETLQSSEFHKVIEDPGFFPIFPLAILEMTSIASHQV